MKRYFKYISIIAAAAMAVVSCTKEIESNEIGIPSGKMKTISIRTSIDTKTTLDDDHNGIVWSSGDDISIFNDVENTNLQRTYSSDVPDLVVEVPEETKEIYAHYPYYSGNATGPTSVSVYISNSQTQKNPGELAGYYYPMVAKGTVTSDNKALVKFYPVASALALNIYKTGLSDGEVETVSSVKVTPLSNSGFIGRQITDITGDNIEYSSAESSESIVVSIVNPLTLGKTKPENKKTFEGQIYVCLAKQSYSNVKFEITTNKGTYTITSGNNPFDCESNDFVPVNINLSNSNASFIPTEELSGTYAIVAKTDEQSYAMANTHADNSSRLDEIEFTDGTTTTPEKSIVWTISKNGDNYSITDASGKFLTASSSNNANVNTDAVYCSIVKNSDGSYSITQKVGDTVRYLSRNDTSEGFAFYGNTSQNCKLYLSKIVLQAPPTLEWGEDAIVLEGDDDSQHEVALTATGAASVTLVIKDESEENVVDWLNAEYTDGKVTYSAEANTDVVRKAIIIATATNDFGIATARINVTQKADNSHVTKGDPWTYTFTSNPFNNNSATLEGLTWQSTIAPGYTNDALSFGTNNAPAEASLSTSGYSGGVSTVIISIKGNSSRKVTAAVSVNGIALKCGGSETVTQNGNILTSYEFSSTSLDVGDIVISFTNPTGGYQIKSIQINPAPATVTGISAENYTSSFVANTTGTYSFDGKVFASYSDGSKVELSPSDYTVSGTVNLSTAGTYSVTIAYGDFSTTIEITVIAEKESYTLTWSSTINSKGVSNYTSDWSATTDGMTWNMSNWNNNNNGWAYVKCGRKTNPSVATIVTSKSISEVIKYVTITIDAIDADYVNSCTLYVASNDSFTSNLQTVSITPETGAQQLAIPAPTANSYYKIEFDCASGTANGFVQISKVVYSTK